MPTGFANWSFLDLSNETASLKVKLKDGYTTPEVDALTTAIVDMTNLRLTNKASGFEFIVSAVRPGLGQREVAALVKAHDNTTFERLSFKVPGMHTAPVYDGVGTDKLKLTVPGDTQAIALKTAIEAVVVHPVTGNAITVDEIWYSRGNK